MVYVALLRGINVGGNNKVEIGRLKQAFEQLGFKAVKTYINSGNVIFSTAESDHTVLQKQIAVAIEHEFGFAVPTMLRSYDDIEALVAQLPEAWVNDANTRCDVMFLGEGIDSPATIDLIPHNPAIEDLVYYPGTVVWHISRNHVRRGQVPKMIGSNTYKQLTIRNITTVRKLYALMQAVTD